jgi:hypothetical protein
MLGGSTLSSGTLDGRELGGGTLSSGTLGGLVLGGLGGGFRRGRARTLDAQVVADRVDLVVLLRLLHFAALLAHAHNHRVDRRHRRKLHLAYTRTATRARTWDVM